MAFILNTLCSCIKSKKMYRLYAARRSWLFTWTRLYWHWHYFKSFCSAYSAGRKEMAAIGVALRFKLSRTGRQVNLAGERVRQDGGGDRRTGRAVLRAGRNQAVIQAWQLDWQASVRKDTQALCPRTAVHPLISDGSKLFFSFFFLKHDNKSEARPGRLAALPMWSDQSRDELRTARERYVFSEIQRPFWLKWWHVARSGDHS